MLRMARPRKYLSHDEQKTFRGRFAMHLQAMLDARGWLPQDLARRLKLRPPAIRKWLRADGGPELTLLERLAAALCTREHPVADYRDVLPPGAKPKPLGEGGESAAAAGAGTGAGAKVVESPTATPTSTVDQWTSADAIRQRSRKVARAGRKLINGGAAGKRKRKKT